MVTAIMAKKNPISPKLKGRPPNVVTRRTVLTVKGTTEWRDWLEELSRFLRMPTSTIVDHALIKYAREHGFDKEAPER